MIAAFILVFSVLALIQFFVSYCRSLLTAYGEVEVSSMARRVVGCEDQPLRGEDFGHVLSLVQLSPGRDDDRAELGAVRAYYVFLRLLDAARGFAPGLGSWARREQLACAHFAAVALDRRIPAPGQAAG